METQKWEKKLYSIFGCCRMNLQSNYTWMLAKRENYPITKMFIKSNKNSIFSNCFLQYLIVICPGLTDFGGTYNIVALTTQNLSHIKLQHLIQINLKRLRHRLL